MSSGGRSRGRRKQPEEEPINHERWLVSYSDMVTVLMALFIVLYAISQVDQVKYESLRASLSAGFGVAETSVLPEGGGPMADSGTQARFPTVEDIVPNLTDGLISENAAGDLDPISTESAQSIAAAQAAAEGASQEDLQAAEKEYDNLTEIRDRIRGALDRKDLGDSVDFRINKEGLVIGMITNDVFFATASNELTAVSTSVIDTITPFLAKLPNEVSVEGHADVVPTGSTFKTNWELSSARATTVLRRMIDVGDVAPGRVAAVGFGDARPLVKGKDAASLAANRRVDLVVLSSQPERVRALLPVIDDRRK